MMSKVMSTGAAYYFNVTGSERSDKSNFALTTVHQVILGMGYQMYI